MKTLLTILCLITSRVLAADPVPAYWWKMTSADTASVRDWGNGSNLTYMPSIATGPILNTAISSYFNFSSTYFDAGYIDFGGLTNMLLSMWIFPTTQVNGAQYIVAGSGPYGGYGWFFSLYNGGTSSTFGNNYYITTGNQIPTNQWAHVVLWFTGRTDSLTNNYITYVNNIRQTDISQNGAPSASIPSSILNFNIGRLVNNTYYYPGNLDDVRIYTNAADITTNLISTLYTNGPAPDIEPPTFTPWKFGWRWQESAPAPFAYPSGLVGLWHMTNDWSDSIQTSNVARYAWYATTWPWAAGDQYSSYNAPTITNIGSVFGKSAYSGGPWVQFGHAVEVTNSLVTLSSGTVFSVSFWLKAGSDIDNVNFNQVIGLGDARAGIIVGGNYTQAGYYISKNIQLLSFNQIPAFGTDTNTFTAAVDSNVWRHIVVTYDMTATPPCHIYKDGVDKNVTTLSGPATNVCSLIRPRWFCFYPPDYNTGLNKSGLSEVQIYNRVLTQAEVTTLFNQTTIP